MSDLPVSTRAYFVARTDNGAGCSVRATSHAAAAHAAMRYRFMRGAPALRVRLWWGRPQERVFDCSPGASWEGQP
jgi:hypothetical protein